MPETSQVVLVADAEAAVRRMLAAAFRQWGVPAHFAGTGPEALELCRQHGPSLGLALLEVALPETDGPATLASLRAIRPNLRCWFMGGISSGYTQAELLECGAEGLLQKPFDLPALRRILGPIAGIASEPQA